MPRINFWSWTLSRFELDQRSRETRLRLERLERLLLRHTTQPHFRALAVPFVIIGAACLVARRQVGEFGAGKRSAAFPHADRCQGPGL